MIKLKNKDTGAEFGTLSEEQLQFLIEQLEEENAGDHDYWFDGAQIGWLQEQGAEAALIELLEQALGDAEEMEVVWERV